ncbi:clostripain-related cysteine peptidase [Desulfatibacillum aliphaticivorans]|nr:clostripain-related cysteine peptidase [Desulfatibacillum aliphaticivorans]
MYLKYVAFEIYHDEEWHFIREGCIFGGACGNTAFNTDGNGMVSIYYYVDSTLAPGSYPIRAKFLGNEEYSAATIEKTLTVKLAQVTFAVFLNGDNNLEPYALDDFYNEIYPQGANDNINYIVLLDRTRGYSTSENDWYTTRLFIVTPETVASGIHAYQYWGEKNMGEQSTLRLFAETAFKDFPAEHSVLVLWDHGSGWQGESKSLTPEESDFSITGTEVELPLPPQVAARLESQKSGKATTEETADAPVKGISYDETSDGDRLSLPEVSGAIEEAGCTVDVVAMDACLMGMVEVAYQIKNVAKYFVASGDTVSGEGFDYEGIGQRLVLLNNPDGRAIASAMVDSYANYYGDYYKQATLSAWDIAAMDPLFDALETFSTVFLDRMDKIPYEERRRLKGIADRMIAEPTYYDLGSLAYYAQLKISDAQVISAAQSLQNQVSGNACVNYFLHNGYSEEYQYLNITAMRGLSIYLPTFYEYDTSYSDPEVLSFANTTWNKTARLLMDTGKPASVLRQWEKEPYALSSTSISMVVNPAVDQYENTVYYSFIFKKSLDGGSGGNSSPYRYTSRKYTDDGLDPNHVYCYEVDAYDGAGNDTGLAFEKCAATFAQTPCPESVSVVSENEILVAWDPRENPDYTEYYCENIGTGDVSGWIMQTQWSNSGLASDQFYKFRVKAKNLDGVETEWKSLGNACLGTCPGNVNKDYRIDVADAILCLQVAAGLTPEGMDKNTAIDAELQVGLDEALYILQIESEFR